MKVISGEALLRFFERNRSYERLIKVFMSAVNNRQELLLSAIDWSNIYGTVLTKYGSEKAKEMAGALAGLPVRIVDVDVKTAEQAARCEAGGERRSICFALALSKLKNAELIDI